MNIPLISFFLIEKSLLRKRAIIKAEEIPNNNRIYIISRGMSESSKLLVATNDEPHSDTATSGFHIFLSVNNSVSFPIIRNKYKQEM